MKRKRRTIRKSTRDYILHRDKGLCRYCGNVPKPRFHYDPRSPKAQAEDGGVFAGYWRDCYVIDHVVPHAKGGSDHPANLVTACEDCNLRKYDNVWQPLPVPA